MKIGIIQQHNSSEVELNRLRLIEKISHPAIPGNVTETYAKVAKDNNVVLVTSLFERRAPGLYHNTAVVFEKDGSIAGKYRKMHIPDDPAYYEKFYFTPGDLGFQPIKTSVGTLGVLVCWDQWYPEAARLMALRGAEILIYPTAIGFESSDNENEKMRQLNAWMTVQLGHAVANGIPVVTVNRVGHEPDPTGQTNGIEFWGSSFVAGQQGEILHCASSTNEEETIVDVNLERTERVRRWWPFLRDRRIDHYNGLDLRLISPEPEIFLVCSVTTPFIAILPEPVITLSALSAIRLA